MLIPWKDLNGRHVTTVHCAKGAEKKIRRLAAGDMRESVARAFQAYGRPLKMVASFKYLGRIMTALDENWPAVVENLWKSRRS